MAFTPRGRPAFPSWLRFLASAGGDAVMVGETHGVRHADEKRGEKIFPGVAVDGDDGGGRVAVDEAGKQSEIVVRAAGQRLGGFLVGGCDIRGHRMYSLDGEDC